MAPEAYFGVEDGGIVVQEGGLWYSRLILRSFHLPQLHP